MALCFFCHCETTLTREHLFSEPVARLAGVNRSSDVVAGLDGTGKVDRPPATLDRWTVRVPCRQCNGGWMARLEVETARVILRWVRSGRRLGDEAYEAIGRWLLKTYFIMAFQDADLRRPAERGEDGVLRYTAKVPFEATRARHLKDGSASAFDNVHFGFAGVNKESVFLTGFGNPSVTTNVWALNCRTAGVAAIALPRVELQLWVVVAPLGPHSVRLPGCVQSLSAGSVIRTARFADMVLRPTAVVLDY